MPPITRLHLRLRPPRQPSPSTLRHGSTHSSNPPPARPYRPQTSAERAAYIKPDATPPPPAPRSRTRHLLSKYLNPFHEPAPAPSTPSPEFTPDPARGIAASERVVREGVLDPRYRAAQRRWLGVILGLVVAIGMTPEMWRRTVRGEKRKEVPRPKVKEGGEGDGEGGEGEKRES